MAKHFILSLAFNLLCFGLSANNKLTTYKIITSYEVDIIDHRSTTNKQAISQLTFDTLGLPVRKVIYDTATGQPEQMVYYHYNNKVLTSVETFNNQAEIINITTHSNNNNIKAIKHYTIVNNKPKLDSAFVLEYEGSNLVLEQKNDAYGKWYQKQLNTYSNGHLIKSTYNYHKKRSGGNLLNKESGFTYGENDKIMLEVIDYTDKNKNQWTDTIYYEYYHTNKLKNKISHYGKTGLKLREWYKWNYDDPSTVEYFNAENKRVRMQRYVVYIKKFENIGILPSQAHIFNND